MIKLTVIYIALLSSVPFALLRPHLGPMVYYWFTFMNPHFLAPGVLLVIPWGKLIAGAAIVAWLVSGSMRNLSGNPILIMLLSFFFWTMVTTFDARFPDYAWTGFGEFAKAVVMSLITMSVVTTRVRLHAMVLILVVSIGFHGVESGLRILLAGGKFIVDGPAGSQYGDRNDYALWLLMTLPWVAYLYLHSAKRLARLTMVGTGALLILAIIGTDSRGAALGLACVGCVYWIFSRRRVVVSIIGGLALLLGIIVLSQERIDQWTSRVETIETYEEDKSAQIRLWVWTHAMQRAGQEVLTGDGFGGFRAAVMPGDTTHRSPHSIYFGVLGEHGWVGLILFLLWLMFIGVRSVSIYRRCRAQPSLYWARDFGFLAMLSLTGYLTAGAFLTEAYSELIYLIAAMVVAVDVLVTRQLAAEAGARRLQLAPHLQPAQGGGPVAPVAPVQRHDA